MTDLCKILLDNMKKIITYYDVIACFYQNTFMMIRVVNLGNNIAELCAYYKRYEKIY